MVGLAGIAALIEIAGIIAAGKTTLASRLDSELTEVVYEDHTINPFCRAFYANPSAYAFETEIGFLLQHYHFAKLAQSSTERNIILDHSLELDVAYASLGLPHPRRNIFMMIHKIARQDIGMPRTLIHLRSDPSIALSRIRERGRDFEQGITIDFLNSLEAELNIRVSQIGRSVKVISLLSSEVDFRVGGAWFENLLNELDLAQSP